MITYYLILNNVSSRAAQYGIGTYIKELARVLKNNPRIHLMYIDFHADTTEYKQVTDVDGTRHYLIPTVSCINKYFYYRNAAYYLIQNIPQKKNLIFHFNYFQMETLAIMLKEAFVDCRLVFTVHYFDWCFKLNGNLLVFKRIVGGGLVNDCIKNGFISDRKSLRIWDKIIALSEFSLDLLINEYQIPRDRIELIYNGTQDISCHAERSGQKEVNSPRVVLFVGRLDEIKGIEYLIKAFRKLVVDMKDLRLVLIGDGDFRAYLSLCEEIRDLVVFTGQISREELEEYYQNACIGVQPSFHEQCSYSAIEMMMYGIPLIISDSTGLKEMMDECPENIVHINESNFDEEDYVNQIVEKMRKLLSDETYRACVSDKMKEIFKGRYTVSKMSESMDKLIQGVFSKRYPFISEGFLKELDEKMVNIINARPDVEIGFSGIAGIGYYLWWRTQQLGIQKSKEAIYCKLWLEECIIYFLDWLEAAVFYELDNGLSLSSVDVSSLKGILEKLRPIHPTQVNMLYQLIDMRSSIGSDDMLPSSKQIVANAIKMYNKRM